MNELVASYSEQLKSLGDRIADQISSKLSDKLSNCLNPQPNACFTTDLSYANVVRPHADLSQRTNLKRKGTNISSIDLPAQKRLVLDKAGETDIQFGTLRSGRRRLNSNHQNNDQQESLNNLGEPKPVPEVKSTTLTKFKQTVMIKPKTSDSAEATKIALRQNIDPVAFSVKEVHFRDNGEATIRCDSHESAQILLQSVQESLNDDFEAEIQTALKPRLKIIGISDDITEDNIVPNLKAQNALSDEAELSLIRLKSKTAIIESDAGTFEKLIALKRVNIGWERCSVFEYVNVLRCYRCCEYGHKADDCKKHLCCPKCAEGHESKDCTSTHVKCVNCCLANQEQKLPKDKQLNIDHSSWSQNCPIYLKRLKKFRQRIDYNT